MNRDTSAEARESIADQIGSIEQTVLQAIVARGIGGATCDEIEVELGMRHQTVSARFTKLAQDGKIEDTGWRRKTRSGRKAIVWIGARRKKQLSLLE